MDCLMEKFQKTNVFQLNIIIPLIKMLDIYKVTKHEFSPDEFCIALFAGEEPTGKCQINYNLVKSYCSHPEEFKSIPISIQDIIIDLFMNIVRYENFFEGIGKHFLKKCHRHHGDKLNETMVLMYILAYRIYYLFFEDSIECFNHFKLTKMYSMVSYLLRPETPNLFHKIGCLDFDEDFVEQKLILPFLEATHCLEKLQKNLKEAIENMKQQKKKNTIPVYMNVLNHPKRRTGGPPATPEELVVGRFARKVPITNYVTPLTQRKLETLRAVNKSNAIQLLNDANENAPKLLRREKYSNDTRKQEVPKPMFVRKPVPTFKSVEVKQTTASILRECARVITDEEKEIKKLKMLTEGGFDPASIVRLKEEEREQMRVKELSKIQEKHLLALISREGAVIAKQSLLDDVKQHAECVRKEKQELYEKLEKWKERHVKEVAEIYERCRLIEQASRDAFNAMVDEKRQKAAEVSQESRQLKAQMTKQREEEMQRKIKTIQEIKAIQSLRTLSYKDFDPTESSGLGLLCEMSLAELKERLFWMKMKLNEDIENRKVVVHRERERQKNMIKDTQKALEDYKVNKRTISSTKILQHSASAIVSPEVDALRKQLEERRAVRLQKEIALRSKKTNSATDSVV